MKGAEGDLPGAPGAGVGKDSASTRFESALLAPCPEEATRPRLAVVILTQGDRPAACALALASVRLQRGPSIQVVLVWNGDSWPTDDDAAAHGLMPDDRLVVLGENRGIPGGRNAGAEASDAEVLVFLDDDAALLGHDVLDGVSRRFGSDPRLGAVALHIVDETGSTQRRHVPRVGAGSAARSGAVTYFVGAACAIRTDAFRSVGGFDGRFWYAMEESDLSWRLLDAGWSIWYDASLLALHPRTTPSRHAGHVLLTARNRVWAAWRSLPLPVFGAYVLTWAVLAVARGGGAGQVLAGYRQAWATRPPREPMRWRTVWRMTLLGRPPVL